MGFYLRLNSPEGFPTKISSGKAYILISLGAPENISADACRSFLREFLGDKHVLSLPFPLRQLLSAHIAKNAHPNMRKT
ncbi:MAG: ferrochelatase [Bacilli bacterium]